MDFSDEPLDAAAHAFWDDVAAVLDRHVTPERLAAERVAGVGVLPDLHRELGRRGWLFPHWARSDGGAELSPLCQRILTAERERRDVPWAVVGSTLLVGEAIRAHASEPLRDLVLLDVARGDAICCLGYTEPDSGSDAAAVRTTAEPTGDGWVLSGQKMFTTGAQVSRYSMVLARTDRDDPGHGGLTMFLVPLALPGITVHTFRTMSGELSNSVFYDDVVLDDVHRLGPVGGGWTRVAASALAAEHGIVDHGGRVVGGPYLPWLRALLDAAVAWAHLPDGQGRRPIDAVVVRRRIAEVDLAVAVASSLNGPEGRIVSSEALIACASDMVDLVGTDLLRGDGPAAEIEYLHRFAQGTAIYGGTTDIHRNLVAEHHLGLARLRTRRPAAAPASGTPADR